MLSRVTLWKVYMSLTHRAKTRANAPEMLRSVDISQFVVYYRHESIHKCSILSYTVTQLSSKRPEGGMWMEILKRSKGYYIWDLGWGVGGEYQSTFICIFEALPALLLFPVRIISTNTPY